MNDKEVVRLMESSTSRDTWDENCDKVKAAHGNDYPDFWYTAIVQSGLIGRVSSKWGGSGRMTISPIARG